MKKLLEKKLLERGIPFRVVTKEGTLVAEGKEGTYATVAYGDVVAFSPALPEEGEVKLWEIVAEGDGHNLDIYMAVMVPMAAYEDAACCLAKARQEALQAKYDFAASRCKGEAEIANFYETPAYVRGDWYLKWRGCEPRPPWWE